MLGMEVVVEVLIEVVVVDSVDVVQTGFFLFFNYGCLGNMMGVRVVIEVVAGCGGRGLSCENGCGNWWCRK